MGGGGGSTNSVEGRGQRERGSGGDSPLVRGSGGNCNFVQEMSSLAVAYPGILFGGGSTNSVEDRENGDLGAVAPSQGFWRQL